ncbi:MAG: PEPxxWA-CTERM sorting domain-containing protein [Pseudomonadota bacterium]
MKAYLLTAAMMLAPISAQAAISILEFEGAPRGAFTAPREEAGYIYSAHSGVLNINGPPPFEQNLEGRASAGGGVASFVAADGGLFTFLSMLYSHYDEILGTVRTFEVQGLRDGVIVATDQGERAGTNLSPYVGREWGIFEPLNLRNVAIDEFRIVLPAGLTPSPHFFAVDRVAFQTAPIPEPSTWAMMILGFGAAGAALRRRRNFAVG